MNTSGENYTGDGDSLRKIRIFYDLGDEAYEQIGQRVRWKEYRRGAEVIRYKDKGNDVYLLARGRVRITIYSASGKEISYQDLTPGNIFGELSAIDGLPRAAHVIVLEAASIGAIPKDDFWQVMNQYPQVAGGVMKRLVSLVRFLSDRVYQFGALDVKDRVRLEILRLARANSAGENTAVIQAMPTHAEIASRINTHREAVTRELNELSRMHLIEQTKRVLTVRDMAKLSGLLPEDV